MKKVNAAAARKTASMPPPVMFDYGAERVLAVHNDAQVPRPPQPWQFLHFHPHYELLYITKGSRALWMHGQEYRAEAGDLIVFRPGEAHYEYAGSRSISFFVLRFGAEDLSTTHLEFPVIRGGSPILSLPHKLDFVALFNRMSAEFKQADAESHLLLGAYLVEFVVKLRRALRERGGEGGKHGRSVRDRIYIAASLLQENMSGKMALDKLARRTLMSTSHLAHSFKAYIGESPRRYQIHERIEKAKALLVETEKPATEIAQLLGYSSPYFFYRQFRAKTGYTTARFRARFQYADQRRQDT